MHIALHIGCFFCFGCCIFSYRCGGDAGTGIVTMINDKTKSLWAKDDQRNIIANKNGELAVTWIDYQA